MHSGNAFDLIRFVAALGVLYAHSYPLTGLIEPIFFGNAGPGALSIYVFFAVSGYLVQRSWDRSKSVVSFIVNRSLRIFPALIVCVIACAFVLGPLVSSASLSAYFSDASPYRFVTSNLAMFFVSSSNEILGVFDGLPYPQAVNGSLWTIKYEVFMYITLLALVSLLTKSTRAIIGVLTCYVCVWALGTYQGLSDPGDLLWRLRYIGLDSRLLALAPFFLIGALLARCPQTVLRPKIAVSLGLTSLFFYTSNYAILVLWLALPYCILVFAYHAPRVFNQFGKHGDFSYGFYLYAFPVQQTMSFLHVTPWPLHVMASTALTLLIAVLSWRLIESPALQLKYRIQTKHPSKVDREEDAANFL